MAVVVGERFYQSLSPRLRAVIDAVGALGALRYRQVIEEKMTQAKEIVREKGTIINVLPDSERKRFREAAQPLYDDYVKQFGPDFINRIQAAQ